MEYLPITPEHYQSYLENYEAWVAKLSQLNPDADEFWVDYWAKPLSLLGSVQEVAISFDSTEEPNEINIIIKPDYGS